MTIAAVAEIAGVSKATVSRVINQRANVHPDTIKMVRKAMEKARYVPRPSWVGRRPGTAQERTDVLNVFAMVVPGVSRGLYWSLQQGLAAKANELHHQILVCNTRNDVYRQADEILQLACKRVAGVALVSATTVRTPPAHVQILQKAEIPVVVLHRAIEGVEAPLIHLPLEQIGYMAGRAAVGRGHRRVAFLAAGESQSSLLHVAGLRRALREAEADLVDDLIVHCPMPADPTAKGNEAAVSQQIARLWKMPRERRPTAIYAPSEWIAEVIYLCLIRMGIRVPQDVSLLSFGDSYREGPIASRLASVVVDESRVGSMAVDLFQEMRRGSRPLQDVQQFVMPPSFFDGETLGEVQA